MTEPKTAALERLQEIAGLLGVPVEQFTTGKISSDLMEANECLRLWSLLKTKSGRQKALDALRRIVDDEPA